MGPLNPGEIEYYEDAKEMLAESILRGRKR